MTDTATASPRPWRVAYNRRMSNWLVANTNGTVICAAWKEADAALIVDAVNERDRLRDIVRRSLPFIEGAIDGVSTILGDDEMLQVAGEGAPPKDVLEAFIADGRRVLREARAAIGEVAANG